MILRKCAEHGLLINIVVRLPTRKTLHGYILVPNTCRIGYFHSWEERQTGLKVVTRTMVQTAGQTTGWLSANCTYESNRQAGLKA